METDRRRRITLLLMMLLTVVIYQTAETERSGNEKAVRFAGSGREVLVIAHRGGAAGAPENTLASLEYAVASGAAMAEMDLRLTKDGVPVVLHDATLLRTVGLDRPVWELDSGMVCGLDAGAWFSPVFAGEKIPALCELLKAAEGRIPLMLELKGDEGERTLLERTVNEIRAAAMEGECVLASDDPELLRLGKELAPELENIYIGDSIGPELTALSYVDGYSISAGGLSAEAVERAHGVGRKVYAWTVNAPGEMERMLVIGVDGLVTDVPELALELLAGISG